MSGLIDKHSRAYTQGWCDGVYETLLQLRDQSNTSPEGGYKGPMPDELTRWLKGVEERLREIDEFREL